MGDFIPDAIHIRHCFLMEYNKKSKATEAHRRICDTYGDVLGVRQCQEWFTRDYSLQYKPKSGRTSLLDNDVLKTLIESNPRQTIQDMAHELGGRMVYRPGAPNSIGKRDRAGK